MVEYEPSPSDTEVEGCLIELELRVDHEGPLDEETLEDIDDEMLGIGHQRTGQRVGVTSTKREGKASIRYAYQESLMTRGLSAAIERLEVVKGFDYPTIHVGTNVFEMSEGES